MCARMRVVSGEKGGLLVREEGIVGALQSWTEIRLCMCACFYKIETGWSARGEKGKAEGAAEHSLND